MARYRNDTGSVLNAPELGRLIGPGEEVDSDLHVAGCTRIDDPPKAKVPAKGKAADDKEAAG